MPRLSLTDFVDIVVRLGSSKANKVAAIKHRPAYDPAHDFYKTIRDALADIHRNGHPKARLQAVLGSLSDPKKQVNYPGIVAGYQKWWGRKSFTWFDPPSSLFSHAGVEVSINPELGLEFGGHKHIIKLYFKGDPLTKHRIDLVTELMEHCLRGAAPAGIQMSVLDTRTSKLFSGSGAVPRSVAALRAELSYIAALWPSV